MRFFYLRDKQRRPVALVATDKSALSEGYIRFTVATWNPIDCYSKEMARTIVQGRLALGRYVELDIVPHIKREIINYIANYDFHGGHFPGRTRKAAKLWLENHPID
jgi:hypothetical protein